MHTGPLKSTNDLASNAFGSTMVELMLVKILNSLGAADVVAVARRAVGDDALAAGLLYLAGLERLDHAAAAAMRRIHLSDLIVTRTLPGWVHIIASREGEGGDLLGARGRRRRFRRPPPARRKRPTFTEAEVRAILGHGPWPVPVAVDPGNRVSGKPEAIEFGERLFFDTRLSGSGKFACATCHVPERNWTDNLRRGAATAEVDRNTPTLMNARLGRCVRLGRRRRQPRGAEHAADPRRRASSLRARAWSRTSCAGTSSSPAATAAASAPAAFGDRRSGGARDVGKALAAFVETLGQSGDAVRPLPRCDRARRADHVPGRNSEAALRGLKIFVGKGSCTSCHSGPNFSDGEPARQRLRRAAPRAGAPIRDRTAGSRCRRCATCCSPRPTATTASSKPLPTW